MTDKQITLGDVAAEYLATLSPDDRGEQQPEIMRFLRWFGTDRPLEQLGPRDLEDYQEQVETSGADVSRRLMPVRALLAYGERQGVITIRLSKRIRIKRATSRARRAAAAEAPEEIIKLTPEGYNQLKEELEYLTTKGRAEVAAALLEARRDKDIRENAPYDAAKQQQALVEARIRELERTLARAEVLSEGNTSGRIGIGSVVVLRDLTYDEEIRYTLVSSSEANPRDGKLSVASPVGKALLASAEGEVVEVDAPAGKIKYRIERVER